MSIFELPIKIRIAIELFKEPFGGDGKNSFSAYPEYEMLERILGPEYGLIQGLSSYKYKLNPQTSKPNPIGNLGIGSSFATASNYLTISSANSSYPVFTVGDTTTSIYGNNFSTNDIKTLKDMIDDYKKDE